MITISVPLYLDGKKVAESTADYINRRQVLIERRSVIN